MEQQRDLPAVISAAEFAVARNDFLDHFADLETAVAKVLHSVGHNQKGEPFSQKVKAFSCAERSPLIAKQNHGQRNQIADAIAALLPLRADIVHSRMQLKSVDGKLSAIFVNVQEAGTLFPTQRILTLAELKRLAAKVVQLTERIAGLGQINPASSQLPPSLAAAGDP